MNVDLFLKKGVVVSLSVLYDGLDFVTLIYRLLSHLIRRRIICHGIFYSMQDI